MLVLSRKRNESIVIDNDVTVTVVDLRPDKVRLGIVAPKGVPVHRQEVFAAIRGLGGATPVQAAMSFSATLHPSEQVLAEYAHFAASRFGLNPSSNLLEHLFECRPCRQVLGNAIAAIT